MLTIQVTLFLFIFFDLEKTDQCLIFDITFNSIMIQIEKNSNNFCGSDYSLTQKKVHATNSYRFAFKVT